MSRDIVNGEQIRAAGEAAFQQRSRRPLSSPNRTPRELSARVLELREQLVADGHDAGADTIRELLARQGLTLSRATIWRILTAEGKIQPQPQKRPFKPTTQGKIERFWQTLKRHLATQPADSLDNLQATLDTFREHYNTIRPHRALGRRTPEFAYQLIPKATPTTPDDPNLWRVRYGTIDNNGKISLRYAGKLLHLGIGRAHARTEIICLIHNLDATVLTHDGLVLAEFALNPQRDYQPKNG